METIKYKVMEDGFGWVITFVVKNEKEAIELLKKFAFSGSRSLDFYSLERF